MVAGWLKRVDFAAFHTRFGWLMVDGSLADCWAHWLRDSGALGTFNGLASLSNLARSSANVGLAFWTGFPGFSPFKEDDILGTIAY